MLQKYGLYFAWLLACIATLGSLYYSEIRHLEPCHLCWYQRIMVYPLTIILGIAAYNGFYRIVPYVLPLLVIGMIIATYQVIIQEVPEWQPIDLCGAGPNCDEKINIGLGFISMPMLSLANFAAMFLLLVQTWRSPNSQGEN
jgi:disulfide bond formation protein DsbB